MGRLFLDANVLFSAAYKKDSALLQLWKLEDVTLVSSRYALEEARINLPEAAHARLDKLAARLVLYEAGPAELVEDIILPGKDMPILSAAIIGKATHLITGDWKHFGKYFGKTLSGVLVLPPSVYLKKRSKTS